jgi:uncharacterized protein (DUF1697 family)
MTTCILLFRGVNVGGHNRLPMDDLKSMFDALGLPGAVTLKQSADAAVRCTRQQASNLGQRIRTAVQEKHGFEPAVLVLRIQELEHAVAANPFRETTKEPKTLHLWFLSAEPAKPDLDSLEQLKGDAERFKLDRKVFYLHTPDGFGQSRVAAEVERCLGVEATGRDWKTVTQVLEMGWGLS